MTMPSINGRAMALAEEMVAAADILRVKVSAGQRGERLIDAGAGALGGIEAGLWMARICMGGLGSLHVAHDSGNPLWPWTVTVRSSQPVIACLGSQYAGWKLAHGDFLALGSGPARALAGKEDIYRQIGYRDQAEDAVIVLETDRPPPPEIVDLISADCGVPAERITVIYAPTQSLAGSVQVVARVLEVALHKAHALEFPLHDIVDGLASVPLAPPLPDFVAAMGRTNDAIIYGGRAHLFVTGAAEAARRLAAALPSGNSRDHGRPFADIFQRFGGDFYAIDPMLFSPAAAIVTALETGRSFRGGAVDRRLLEESMG